MRYEQLKVLIKAHKPKTIVEVGTWNGERALMMAEEALKYQEKVHYTGFDLFEDATEETDAREFNVKPARQKLVVEKKLADFKTRNSGFTFELISGDTRTSGTLHTAVNLNSELRIEGRPKIDLVFIDGGHSIETIKSDYERLKHAKIVVIDDFYVPKDGHPDTSKFGCNTLVEESSDQFLVLPQADPVKGGGKVKMVLTPSNAWPGKINLAIKTKNCVSDKNIAANICYNMTMNDRWVPECEPHNHLAVLVSGGPSFRGQIDEIRRTQNDGAYVVSVKHSHDTLIKVGITPWACMLLDPRAHVKDFVENPHKDVIYFMASMCHPSTADVLLDNKAKIWGYHAHVGAEEEKTIAAMSNGAGHILVGGGSTSAVRGISVLHCMGFRRFHLYGYDSCYEEKPDFSVKTKMGQQKYFQVEVSGRKFFSDAELVAQAQDFEKLMKQQKDFVELEVFGDGMIPHIWQTAKVKRKSFMELIK